MAYEVTKGLALQVAMMLPDDRAEAEEVLRHVHTLLLWRSGAVAIEETKIVLLRPPA